MASTGVIIEANSTAKDPMWPDMTTANLLERIAEKKDYFKQEACPSLEVDQFIIDWDKSDASDRIKQHMKTNDIYDTTKFMLPGSNPDGPAKLTTEPGAIMDFFPKHYCSSRIQVSNAANSMLYTVNPLYKIYLQPGKMYNGYFEDKNPHGLVALNPISNVVNHSSGTRCDKGIKFTYREEASCEPCEGSLLMTYCYCHNGIMTQTITLSGGGASSQTWSFTNNGNTNTWRVKYAALCRYYKIGQAYAQYKQKKLADPTYQLPSSLAKLSAADLAYGEKYYNNNTLELANGCKWYCYEGGINYSTFSALPDDSSYGVFGWQTAIPEKFWGKTVKFSYEGMYNVTYHKYYGDEVFMGPKILIPIYREKFSFLVSKVHYRGSTAPDLSITS